MPDRWKRGPTKAIKPKTRKQLGRVFAVKLKATKHNGWLPDECCVRLDGEKGATGYLLVCGWSISPVDETWDVARLEKYMTSIAKDWRHEFGTGWKLEIRSV